MKRVLSILGAVLLTANMFGQATQEMSYQAVIMNSSNVLVTSSPIGMRVSILQGSDTGTPVYVETHTSATNENGLVTIELGGGTPVTGTFRDIVGSTGTYFLKTETDPTGGVNYTAIVGTSRLLSEPYALETTHYIGESYGGGIVFFVYDEGQHGLITTTVDQNARIQRQNGTDVFNNAVKSGINSGKYNSERITAIKGEGADDAQISANYKSGYYSDWYLPSKYELKLLYLHRAVLGGYDDFAKGWSSIEVSSVNSWFQSFATGGTFSNGKDDGVYVRVLRRF